MHLFLLALVFGIFTHDQIFDLQAAATGVNYGWIDLLTVTLMPKLLVGAAYHAVCIHTRRRIGRPGSHRALRRMHRLGTAVRFALILLYGLDLALGALLALRLAAGDWILLDELLFMLPTLAVLIWMWAAYYLIERRLRESPTIRLLDDGDPIPPIWTRPQYIVHQLRHQVALILLPLLVLMAWIELLGIAYQDEWFAMPDGAWAAVQLAGVACVMTLAPLVIRHVWDTSPLPDGPLRERLLAMCRYHRVGVRELLLWRTFGGMVNAAVMGLVAPVRYILLTDALLDRMPQAQVEAVMAHELAHVRRHHLFWLLAVAVGLAGSLEIALRVVFEWVRPEPAGEPILVMASMFDPWMTWLNDPRAYVVAASGPVVAAWVVAFGWVSRRYERQADTFAVQHMVRESSEPQRDALGRAVVDAASGLVMIQALQAVADLNHLDARRKSWRHGSIAWRQEYLRSIVGLPIDALPIDRTVRRINAAALGLIAVMAAAAAWTGAVG